ncbi:tetratricopeptide repeat protein [Shewanella sp. JM162201]|uniref:Tetratricopeptide repeat protein n=1 Tax=Shewanella jiangmenensis TaxID=2837387 RepID=A0ABS5UYC0_9GAMM|nr:tetratricopeptide repeat protein [Shewanella jiangmenensis]MBT1443109.1 tetratricopeptide repeat protein [Shewanella jiangmenensis]
MQGINPGNPAAGNSAEASASVVQLSRDNVQQVLERSLDGAIFLSFYAPSHPESVAMNEALSRHIQGRALLALVNCEAEMEIASYFRIQALPTVLVMSQGQPVDGFAGGKSDGELSAFLEQHLPAAWLGTFDGAKAKLAEGDANAALAMLKSIASEASGSEFVLTLADAEIACGELTDAEARLATVGLADQDSYYHSLKAKLQLAKEALDTPEIRELQSQFGRDPDNISVRIALSRALAQAKRDEEALELLFELLKKELNAGNGEVKQTFMDLMTAMGQTSSAAKTYRRKLYGLLY